MNFVRVVGRTALNADFLFSMALQPVEPLGIFAKSF